MTTPLDPRIAYPPGTPNTDANGIPLAGHSGLRSEADWKSTNPKDQAATTRIGLSSFPPSAVAYGALAFTEGGLKYGEYNWREAGVSAFTYIDALKRHADKWWNGEDEDPKTLVPHLANAIACVAVLIDAVEQGNLIDDRPPKQSSALYDRLEEKVKHLQNLFPRRAKRFTARKESP